MAHGTSVNDDGLYFKTTGEMQGYWIAAYDNSYGIEQGGLMWYYFSQTLNVNPNFAVNTPIGFRPVICLKSNVKLVERTGESYDCIK